MIMFNRLENLILSGQVRVAVLAGVNFLTTLLGLQGTLIFVIGGLKLNVPFLSIHDHKKFYKML